MPTSALDTLFLRLLIVDQSLLEPHWWNFRHQLSRFWILYFNLDAGAHIAANGVDIPVEANRPFLIPPGTLQDRLYCTAPVRCFYIVFDAVGSFLPALTLLVSEPRHLIEANDDFAVRSTVLRDRLLTLGHTVRPEDIALQCETKALLYGFLGAFLQSLSPDTIADAEERTVTLAPIRPALARIESGYGEPLTVPELARLCGMSEGHFTRQFNLLIGKAPHRYLLDARIKAAAEALLLTEASIEQIAATCGFGNRYYFSRMFARQVGVPPATYRRSPTPYVFLEPTASGLR